MTETLDRAQAPQNQNSEPETQNKKHEFTRSQKVTAAIAGSAVLGGGALFGFYKGVENGTQKAIENLANSPAGNSAPAVPGQEGIALDQEFQHLDPATTAPETFKDQPYEAILSETVPILEERRAASLNAIDTYFGSLGQPSLPKPEEIENPTPENMAAQVFERNISADIMTITEISQTNPVLAENLARAVFNDPTTYRDFVDGFNGKKHAVRTSVVAVSPKLPSVAIGGHDIQVPSYVLLNTNMDETVEGQPNTSPTFNRVLSEYTYDGGKTQYAVTLTMQSDNQHFVEYPENLVPAQK